MFICAPIRVKQLGGTEEMARSENFLIRKCKDLSLDHQHPPKSQVLQVHLKCRPGEGSGRQIPGAC